MTHVVGDPGHTTDHNTIETTQSSHTATLASHTSQFAALPGAYAQVINAAGYCLFDGTDETTQLASAGTAAAGKTLWIPKGKTVKTRMFSPAANTRITGGGTIDLIDDGTSTSTSVFVNQVDGVTIDGVTITQSNATGRTSVYGLIRAEGATRLTIRGNTFGKASSAFIFASSDGATGTLPCTDLIITENRGSGSYADGIHISRGCSRVTITNNDLDTMGDDAIAVNSLKADGAVTYPTITDVIISGNRIKTVTPNGSGISAYGGTRIDISGNQIDGTPNFGVNVQQILSGAQATWPAVDIAIRGNRIRSTPSGSIYLLGQATAHITGVVIADNTCDPLGTTAGHNGVWLQLADGAAISGNRVNSGYDGVHLLTVTNSAVTGNACNGLSDAGVYLDACTGVAVTGNTLNSNVGGVYEPNGDHNLIVGNLVRGNSSFAVSSAGTATVNANNQNL